MVRLDRTTQVSRGKFPEASQWAKDVSAFLKKNHGMNIECFAQRFGPAGVIVWHVDFASLAELDSTMAKATADKKYSDMLAAGAADGLFIEGALVDRLLVSLA